VEAARTELGRSVPVPTNGEEVGGEGPTEQQESNVGKPDATFSLSAAVVTRAASRLEVLTHRLRLWDSEGRYLVVERLGTGETEVIRCEDGTVVEVDKSRLKPYDRCQIGALVKGEDEYAPTTRVAGGPSRPLERPAVGPRCGCEIEVVEGNYDPPGWRKCKGQHQELLRLGVSLMGIV